MSAPGMPLRTWASRWLPPATMARVIDPAIADIQHEVGAARAAGRHAYAAWLHAGGTLAVLRIVLMLGAQWLIAIPSELRPEDRGSLVRAIALASGAGAVALALLAAWPYWNVSQWSEAGSVRLFLLLIPQAVPVAGATFVIVAALAARSHIQVPRVMASLLAVALLVTMVSLVVSGWVLPVANQSARSLAFHDVVLRGLNELRLDELYGLAVNGTRPSDLLPQVAAGASLGLHVRLAFAASPAFFAVLALCLVRRTRHSYTAAVVSPLALVAYLSAMLQVAGSDMLPLSAILQAWLPNALLVVLAALVRGQRPFVSAKA